MEAAASAQQPVASVHASTPAEIRYRRVSVDIASSRPDAVVERRQNVKEDSGAFLIFPWRDTSSTWEQICVAPCLAADLDRYSTYRVATANGISSSSAFTLPQTGDTVHLRLDAGSRTANRAGVTMGAFGFAAVIVGGSLLIAAPDARTHTDDVHERTAGFITGAAGIALLAIGIPLAILTRTYVFADDKPVRAADARSGLRFAGNGFVF